MGIEGKLAAEQVHFLGYSSVLDASKELVHINAEPMYEFAAKAHQELVRNSADGRFKELKKKEAKKDKGNQVKQKASALSEEDALKAQLNK